jgi:SAM-dependent methyltransferase
MPPDRIRAPAVGHVNFLAAADRLRGLGLADAFTHIYETNLWGGDESRSGLGSAVDATRVVRAALPELLRALGATTLLDIPCGDFGWLSHVDLGPVRYTGADIVAALVERNTRLFADPGRRFVQVDLTRDPLPASDLVLCRDCLVHLSFANIARALENVRRSGSSHLLTTTFTGLDGNTDIEDGDWRALNLERPPFNFPPPAALIIEECREAEGTYDDKSLGLWPVAQLPTQPVP